MKKLLKLLIFISAIADLRKITSLVNNHFYRSTYFYVILLKYPLFVNYSKSIFTNVNLW